MRDSQTGQRLIVVAREFAPCVVIRSFEDYDYLEDILTEQHGIRTTHRETDDGFELYIHSPLDLVGIQRLLDEITEPSNDHPTA